MAARFLVLCLLFLSSVLVSSVEANKLIELYDGLGTQAVPSKTQRIPSSFNSFLSNSSEVKTIDDDLWYYTSLATSSGQYDCQIFTCQLDKAADCSKVQSASFSWFGYEQQENLCCARGPITDIFINVWNWTSAAWQQVDSFSDDSHAPPGELGRRNLARTTPYTYSLTDPDLFSEVSGVCAVSVSVCGLYTPVYSTPLLFLGQSDGSYNYFSESAYGDLPTKTAGPTWPEDYLVIPADKFGSVPDSGVWKISVMESKTEISYIDAVELWLVDHPETVQVLPDWHATGTLFGIDPTQLKAVSSCVDQSGNDCSSYVAAYQDGSFWTVDPLLDPSITQFIEFGLGVTSAPTTLQLVIALSNYQTLQDWNVGPKHTNPLNYYLQQWSKDSNSWVGVGYPYDVTYQAGNQGSSVQFTNPKMELFQALLDLSGMQFNQNSGETLKLRLIFTMLDHPIRVDQISVYTSANYPLPTPSVQKPTAAVLGFHGVLADQWQYAYNQLSSISYSEVLSGAGMPDIVSGNFTAYGNVLSLVTSANDEHVILGAGDEIKLEFAAPASLATSPHTTSVIVHTTAYYKKITNSTNATPNPIPYKSMTSYPTGCNYDTTAHATYLSTYNTRQYTATADHLTLWTDFFGCSATLSSRCQEPSRRSARNRDLIKG